MSEMDQVSFDLLLAQILQKRREKIVLSDSEQKEDSQGKDVFEKIEENYKKYGNGKDR